MAEVNARANIAALQQEERELPLTQDSIDGYLEYLRSIGRAQGTLDSYRRKIRRLYQALPENSKLIRRDTLLQWRDKLAEDAAAVKSKLSGKCGCCSEFDDFDDDLLCE